MGKIIVSKEATAPANSPAGSSTITITSSGNLRLTDESGVSVEFGPASPFGSNFVDGARATSQTNSTTTQEVFLSLSEIASIVGSRIRIGVTVSWGMSTTARPIVIQLKHGNSVLGELKMRASSSGTDTRNWNTGFFYLEETVAIPKDIVVTFSADSNNDTATMYYAGLEVWRVS